MSVKKDQIWQRPHLERARAEIRARLLASGDSWSAVRAEAKTAARDHDEGFEASLNRFLVLVESAKEGVRAGLGEAEELSEWLAEARAVLSKQNVTPTRSRLAYLHTEIARLESELAVRQGNSWSAAWRPLLGSSGEEPEDPGFTAIQGDRFLRLGDVGNAIECYVRAEEGGDQSRRPLHLLRHARALRLKGSRESARLLLEGAGTSDPLETARRLASDQQDLYLLLALARETGDLMLKAEAWLWAAAVASKRWLDRVPPFRTALKARLASFPQASAERSFGEIVFALLHAYESRSPVSGRVQQLGEALELAERVPDIEQELLLWAAATRWLVRVQQGGLAGLTLSRYQGLSLRLSGGAQKDVLRCFDDDPALAVEGGDAWDRSRFQFQVMLRTLPTGQMRRLLEVVKLASACVGAVGRHSFRRRFSGALDRGELTSESVVALCEVTTGYLGRMRGPAMKIGQLLGSLGFELPPEAQESFRGLHDAAPALDPRCLETILEQDFGRSSAGLFKSFTPKPIATGSIGQVHRAVTREGDQVVVKIQCPRMPEIVRNDFRTLALLLPIAKRVLPHWDTEGIVKEIESKMLLECDYLAEAENQRYFFSRYQDDPFIKVPRLHDPYCSPRVLTSEFVPGLTLKSFSRMANDRDRSRAAETMFRWHYDCILNHRYFNTDPHGGNYLFLRDRVAFIDFGSVKSWKSEQSEGLVDIIFSLIFADQGRFERGMKRAEMFQTSEEIDLREHYRKTADGVLRVIARDEEIAIEKELVRKDVEGNLLNNPDVYRSLSIHKENAFLFKTHWAFYSTLSQLAPRSNWHRIARSLAEPLAAET